MKQSGAATALQGILTALDNAAVLTEASTQDIIKQVIKEKNLKKGLVMRSLRAALTGDMHGPDLVQSWLILNERNLDKPRLQSALRF